MIEGRGEDKGSLTLLVASDTTVEGLLNPTRSTARAYALSSTIGRHLSHYTMPRRIFITKEPSSCFPNNVGRLMHPQ